MTTVRVSSAPHVARCLPVSLPPARPSFAPNARCRASTRRAVERRSCRPSFSVRRRRLQILKPVEVPCRSIAAPVTLATPRTARKASHVSFALLCSPFGGDRVALLACEKQAAESSANDAAVAPLLQAQRCGRPARQAKRPLLPRRDKPHQSKFDGSPRSEEQHSERTVAARDVPSDQIPSSCANACRSSG